MIRWLALGLAAGAVANYARGVVIVDARSGVRLALNVPFDVDGEAWVLEQLDLLGRTALARTRGRQVLVPIHVSLWDRRFPGRVVAVVPS